jgi:hypothetical protein
VVRVIPAASYPPIVSQTGKEREKRVLQAREGSDDVQRSRIDVDFATGDALDQGHFGSAYWYVLVQHQYE